MQGQGAGSAPLAVGAERRHDLVGIVGECPRVAILGGLDQMADAHVPARPVVGVVPREEVQVRVDRDRERIAQTGREDLQLRAVRPDAEDAAAPLRERGAVFPLGPWNP